ncbi:MAG: MFS transporter [Collinsella sp.]
MSDNCTVAPANGRITGTQIRIVAVVVLGAFLALLNQTVMSPALPVIMSDFAIDASTAQWIMSIYPLVSGIMVPVSAFLIDKFSTRALFFGATLVFALGTLLCAAAPDFLFLIIGRVLQAAGSGVLMPLVSVVPMLVFPSRNEERLGMAASSCRRVPRRPRRGGAVIDTYGWRTMIALSPPAILVLVLGVFMLKNVGELKNPSSTCPYRPSPRLRRTSTGSRAPRRWVGATPCSADRRGCRVLRRSSYARAKSRTCCSTGTPKTRVPVAAIIVTLINAAWSPTRCCRCCCNPAGASAETGMATFPAAAVGIISPISGVVFDKFGPRAISIVGLAPATGARSCSLSTVNTPILVVALFCMLQSAGQSSRTCR